jgi:MSHA biogenesis protein MshI
MAWFRRSKNTDAYAVLVASAEGAGVVRLEPGERPQVAVCHWSPAANLDAAALARLAADAGVPRAPLITLLARGEYQMVMTETPNVPKEELQSALRWRVRDLIPFHIDDAVLETLEVPGAGAGRQASLYVVAAQARAVREETERFRKAGLDLQVVDIRELAQRNVSARLEPEGYAVAMLHFDGRDGLLTFTWGGDLVLARDIESRGAEDEALLERVALEAQRSVDYFERQYHAFPLARLYLVAPPGAEGLRRRLAEYLPIAVEPFELASVFDAGGHEALADPARQARLFHLLGAALRSTP